MSTAFTDEHDKRMSADQIYPAAGIEKPASANKRSLIKRFLRAIGLQEKLDSGSFLDRYAMPGGVLWRTESKNQVNENFVGGVRGRLSALRSAYDKHRAFYQQAYEDHVNWEFTEQELATIVAFLESPSGRHYLDGRWRMEAYTGTNTEDVEEAIVTEAQASLAK
ncbi:hypothetical protein [Sphingomonas sp. CLY1604]|uniref:hypothetical protein n=1 Tax=Sphingomonas sp. CLY1604 TaxID=3457786 RepID=UPI003FD87648